MPATINPIRKALVKNEYLKTGGNGYKALKAGGLSESTARHRVRANNKLLNVVKAEIEEDIKSIITVDYVLNKLKYFVDNAKNDADRIRATELLGKWQAMFTDKQEISQSEKEDNQFSLERLSRIKQSSTN